MLSRMENGEEDKGLLDYGDESMNDLVDHFGSLIERKKCNVSQVLSEWDSRHNAEIISTIFSLL